MKTLVKKILAFALAVQTTLPAIAKESQQTADLVNGVITEKDYLKGKGHFENNVNGWSAYADAAATSPVDGTGGTATHVQCTRTTSSPLAGEGSFALIKGGAGSGQGEGCSIPFTIDPKHKGTLLRIFADYAISSGSYTDDAVRFYIFDVTNSRLIEPTANKIKNTAITSGVPIEPMEFQTSIDSTSYRLIIHIAGTDANSYTLKLDDIKIGKMNVSRGPPTSSWQSYTPTTYGMGTATINNAQYRRVGDTLQLQVSITTGTVTSADCRFDLPSGIVPNTSKIGPTRVHTYGYGTLLVGTNSGNSNAVAGYYNSNYPNSVTLATGNGSTAGQFNQLGCDGIVAASGNKFTFEVLNIPITGWSDNLPLGFQDDGRSVTFAASRSGGHQTGINTNGTNVKLVFNDVSSAMPPLGDSHGTFDTTNGRYVAPLPGDYFFASSVFMQASNVLNSRYSLRLFRNGSIIYQGPIVTPPASTVFGVQVSGLVRNVKASDYFEVYLYGEGNNSVSTLTMDAGYSSSIFTGQRISGPAQPTASDTVAARYTDDTGTAIGTSIGVYKFTSKAFDTHNAYNTSTGIYTVPVPGKYRITTKLFTANISTLTTAQSLNTAVYKNGSNAQFLEWANGTGAVTAYSSGGTTFLNLNVGDQIAIYASCSVATTGYNSAGGFGPYFEIERVGNY